MNPVFQALRLFLPVAILCSCAPRGTEMSFLPGAPDAALAHRCARAFPRHGYQFVHALDFSLAHGEGSSLIGVTDLEGTALKCALLTIEGMTLFEAEYTDNRLRVLRAVAPFTAPDFARNLLDDVRAMFVRPRGWEEMETGIFDPTGPGCRVVSPSGSVTDILPAPDGCWTLRIHDADGNSLRTVTAGSCTLRDGYLLPRRLTLVVPGPAGYRLRMQLLNAEQPPGTNTPDTTHKKN